MLLPDEDMEAFEETRMSSTSLSLLFLGRLLRSRLPLGLEEEEATSEGFLRLVPTERPSRSGSMAS